MAKAKTTLSSRSPKNTGIRTHDHPSGSWTFLTNYFHVLILLDGNPDIVMREIAVRVGITERAVQRIVLDLESEGFVKKEKVGRKNRYHVLANKPLRHPLEAHCRVGDLLRLIRGLGAR